MAKPAIVTAATAGSDLITRPRFLDERWCPVPCDAGIGVDPFLVRPGDRATLVNAIAVQSFWHQLVLGESRSAVDGCARSIGCGPVARTHRVGLTNKRLEEDNPL
jgi:hypothetical protein